MGHSQGVPSAMRVASELQWLDFIQVKTFFSFFSIPLTARLRKSAIARRVEQLLSFTGMMSLLALSFLTPYFYYIPRATLSAVLISAVIFLIDWEILAVLWKGSSEFIILLIVD